jgi:hypothetical protein
MRQIRTPESDLFEARRCGFRPSKILNAARDKIEGMVSARLPRFNRSPKGSRIRLTDRDREILRHVHRHRFLRSDHLTSLLPGSRQRLLRRMQLLFHHGYLERPRCQIDYYHRGGSRAIAYGLGNKAAGLLKRELALPYHQLDWPKKNLIGRLFLDHALLVSDFMVALEVACRRQGMRLLRDEDMNLRDESAAGRHPFRWRVDIPGGPTCTVVPDRVFGLEFLDGGRSWFVLEADRATMPVMRSNLDQSSFRRKMLAYQATWAQNLHRDRFGWQRFRVLTVTTSPDRLDTMRGACRALQRGQGLFLFADGATLGNCPDLLAYAWKTCRDGESGSLLLD